MAEVQNLVQEDSQIFYTTKDLMNMLHIGKNKANELMAQKDFPSMKLGNKWIIKKEYFDEFMNRWKNKEYKL